MLDSYFNYLEKNRLIEPDIAIHCDTREKAEYLIAMYAASGKAWSSTSPLITNENEYVTRWGKDKEATCYRVNESDYKYLFKSIANVYEKKGVIVIEFQDLFPFISLTEQPIIEDESNKKKNKSKLFGKKKTLNVEETNDNQPVKNDEDLNVQNHSLPNESIITDDKTNFDESQENNNALITDEKNIDINKTVIMPESNKADIKTFIDDSPKQKNKDEPKQNIDILPVKEDKFSNSKNKGSIVKDKFDSVNLPIMKNFKINDDMYRLNNSLICEKCYGAYWYPILNIEKYISILNHMKNGDVKYVE